MSTMDPVTHFVETDILVIGGGTAGPVHLNVAFRDPLVPDGAAGAGWDTDGRPGGDTLAVLHRFDQEEVFKKTPDATLQLLHQKAVESGDRDIIFALSELNFLTGEKVRRSVKPWEPRDARDYYLASAVYAWFFLGSTSTNSLKGAFDSRFRAAGELVPEKAEAHFQLCLAQLEGGAGAIACASGMAALHTHGDEIRG